MSQMANGNHLIQIAQARFILSEQDDMMAANFGRTTLFNGVRGLLVHIGTLHRSITN